METALTQVAIQVPAVLVLGYVFIRVLTMVMDVQGRKIDRLADAVDTLTHEIRRP